MNNFIYTIIVNMVTNTCKSLAPLDFHQGDSRLSTLMFHLNNGTNDPVTISEDHSFKIEFYKNDTLLTSDDVNIENRYRGRVSYVVTDTLTKNPGRYTSYLVMYDKNNEEIFRTSFILNVAKSHNYQPNSTEIALTKEYKQELDDHMLDEQIHLSEIDRDFLDTFSDQVDELLKVIKENQMVTELELPEDEDHGLDITKLKSGTYLTMNDGYLKLPLSTIEDDHRVPVNNLLLKNAWLLVRNDTTGYKCNVVAHRRVYSVVRDKDATTPYYTYYMTVDAKNSSDLLFDLITQLREEAELTERKVDEIYDENGNPLEDLPEGAYASALAIKDTVTKVVPAIINDSELNEYMLSSGTYKPLTNNENNIFKLNDNTILIL